jgi:alginate O-acetyltransferase complex protein AlgI
MSLDSSYFAIFMVCVLALYTLGGAQWRKTVLLVASLYFLVSYIAIFEAIAAFTAVIVSGYVMALYARRVGRVNAVIVLYIIVAVGAFLIIKKYQIVGLLLGPTWISHGLVLVGYSYILFRQIHVIVDSAQQVILDLDFISYLTYLISFLTLLAGPIQRYQNFRKQWDRLGEWQMFELETTLQAFMRISSGYLGVYAISPMILALPAAAVDLTGLPASTPGISMLNFYSYPIYLFFNFAGYCSIVIGLGMLLGFTLPENFNKPYFSDDPIDFWNRWHITLSTWLRDYVFTPYYKMGISRFSNQALFFAVTGYFLAFFITGMWHGSTLGYLVLGLMYGASNAITKLIEGFSIRFLGRNKYKKLRANRAVMFVSTVVTLHFIAFSLQFVQVDRSADIINFFNQLAPK